MSLIDSPSTQRPSSVSSHLGSAGLPASTLRTITRDFAARVDLWPPLLQFRTDDHWSLRLHADDDVDVWLITWLQEQSTSLHDHGGSAGAFTVVQGQLREYLASDGVQDINDINAGSSLSFGPRHIHDVYNPHAEAAVSLHAYSPPLTQMSYYRKLATGGVARVSTVQTTTPEGRPPVLA